VSLISVKNNMLTLLRTYYTTATHGKLMIDEQFISFAIELPWRENRKRISCIHEGTYTMRKSYSAKDKWHYIIQNVHNRSLILFHTANHAQKELLGCIAPVTKIIKEGIGEQSRKAMQKLMGELEKWKINGTVKLVIKKENDHE